MTIRESVLEHIKTMQEAGVSIAGDDLSFAELKEFGDLEFTKIETRRGRGGKPFTMYHTAQGIVGWFPLANCRPRLSWFKSQKITPQERIDLEREAGHPFMSDEQALEYRKRCSTDKSVAATLGEKAMKVYLGDGVYGKLDGANRIVLTTENGYEVTNTIVLEPEVWMALHRWVEGPLESRERCGG